MKEKKESGKRETGEREGREGKISKHLLGTKVLSFGTFVLCILSCSIKFIS
jgi:hypothetical protein